MKSRLRFFFIVTGFVVTACVTDAAQSSKNQLVFSPILSEKFVGETITQVDISSDGKQILSGSAFGGLRSWSKDNLKTPRVIKFQGELISAKFIGDTNQILLANNIGSLKILSEDLGKVLYENNFPLGSSYKHVDINNNLIAYGEHLLDKSERQLLDNNFGGGFGHSVQTSLQIYSNNFILSSGFHDQSIIIRDIANNSKIKWTLNDPVTAAAISEDGKYLVAGSKKGDCYVWMPPKKETVYNCSQSGSINKIHINSTLNSFTVIQNNSFTAYQIRPFKKLFSKKVGSVIRTSDYANNNWLSLGLDSGEIQIWDIGQKVVRGSIKNIKERITTTKLHSTAKLLLVGTYGGQVVLYKISE